MNTKNKGSNFVLSPSYRKYILERKPRQSHPFTNLGRFLISNFKVYIKYRTSKSPLLLDHPYFCLNLLVFPFITIALPDSHSSILFNTFHFRFFVMSLFILRSNSYSQTIQVNLFHSITPITHTEIMLAEKGDKLLESHLWCGVMYKHTRQPRFPQQFTHYQLINVFHIIK